MEAQHPYKRMSMATQAWKVTGVGGRKRGSLGLAGQPTRGKEVRFRFREKRQRVEEWGTDVLLCLLSCSEQPMQ